MKAESVAVLDYPPEIADLAATAILSGRTLAELLGPPLQAEVATAIEALHPAGNALCTQGQRD